MKKYLVNVNGKNFEVTVEPMDEKDIVTPKKVENMPTSAEGEKITSPMPGNILSVNVAQGDKVKKGQVLMILEAMKMENEIMAPKDGVVASLNISKGATVESGTLLCVIQ